jgi:hypothetical protein
MRFGKVALPLLLLLSAGCGYRLAARRGDAGAGAGSTIAVPTFVNRTDVYRIEQRVSDVLRKELARSTRYRVTPEPAGDVVISGEVVGYGFTPVVFNELGRATEYAMSFGFKLVVTDSKSGVVLFRNDSLPVREIFQLSQTPGDFVPEDPAAWDRVAEKLASSLVAALVHRAP